MDVIQRENLRIRRAYLARRKAMRKLRERGWTLQKIGERYGLTRQRVQRILESD